MARQGHATCPGLVLASCHKPAVPKPACSPRDWLSPMANRAQLGELTLGLDKEGRPRSQGQWFQCCALAVPHFSYCGQPLHQHGGCLSWFLFPPPSSAPAAPRLTPGCGAGGSVPLSPWQHQAERWRRSQGRELWGCRGWLHAGSGRSWLGLFSSLFARPWGRPAMRIKAGVLQAANCCPAQRGGRGAAAPGLSQPWRGPPCQHCPA